MRVLLVLGVTVLLQGSWVSAQEQPMSGLGTQAATLPESAPDELLSVNTISLVYAGEQHPDQPPLTPLNYLPLLLGYDGAAYVGARYGMELRTTTLEQLQAAPPINLRTSAIKAIAQQIVENFNKQNIIGVLVNYRLQPPQEGQVAPSLILEILTGRIADVRTIAQGDRFATDRINNPAHRRIAELSPLKPAASPTTSTTAEPQMAQGSLIRKDLLDAYVDRLNRQPARHVDVAVSAAEQPGGVTLDYLVSETKPWSAYFQGSNTGTKQTNAWRERFGFINNQLTNSDDTFSLDYVTAGFDQSNSVDVSYERPIFKDGLRARGYANYSDFAASDVGLPTTGIFQEFSGQDWGVGAELVANVFQHRELFIDLVGGMRYEDVQNDNKAAAINGSGRFIIPYVGARLERMTETTATTGSLNLEFGLSQGDSTDVAELGRFNPSDNWAVLRGEFEHSTFIEPILYPHEFEAQTLGALQHEIAFSLRTQYSFGNRLIPVEESTAGGLYTVRGYDESVVAGDSMILGSAEYRWHITRGLPVQPDPSRTPLFGKPFRRSPQYRYGPADWDLIFRAFIDGGAVYVSDAANFEQNSQTLLGTGIGAELKFESNMSIRVDWGVALHDVEGTSAGHNVVNVVFTLSY